MSKIIGIDLGTTNSLAAYWSDGAVHLIPNAFGETLTPSVVSIDDQGTVYVGKVAKERLITHPDSTVSVFKRSMGTGKRWQLGGKTYLPEELSALVLRRLKEDAEAYLGETIEEAIISVPAYFGDQARKATREAGRLAGLKVERILNEPSAAALACQHLNPRDEAKILVFDFGGGTLDVSLVECFDNVLEIVAVSGNNRLGGSDFDQAIAREFCKRTHRDFNNLAPGLRQNLLKSAEQIKMALTEQEFAMMVVTTPDFQDAMELTRKDLIKIIAPALQKLADPINSVLRDGNVTPGELSAVVMVGGSSKMPVVQQYLKFIMKKANIRVSNPDRMIAMGVGIYAGIKERDSDLKDIVMTDLCPFSLGTNTHNDAEPGKAYMSVIIPRNSMLPVSRTEIYSTSSDNQTVCAVGIYQGENMFASENVKLGEITVPVPAAPKGQEKISVRFTYDINGLLIVNVQVPSTKYEKELTLFNGQTVTDQATLNRAKELAKLTISASENEENKLLLEQGERIYAQLSGEYKEIVKNYTAAFSSALMTEDKYKIFKAKKRLIDILKQLENYFVMNQVDETSVDAFQEWLDEAEEQEDDDDYWDSLFNSGDTDF